MEFLDDIDYRGVGGYRKVCLYTNRDVHSFSRICIMAMVVVAVVVWRRQQLVVGILVSLVIVPDHQ